MIQKPQQQFFRSYDEMMGSPALDATIDHDFAAAVPAAGDGLSRRRWLQIMGASMAFGSMVGCRMGEEVIAPFTFRPHNRTPGIPEDFATSIELGGIGKPLLAKCYDGRPIKLDGNPDHPNSGTGTDTFTQAQILELYDPDRSRTGRIDGASANWKQVLDELQSNLGDGSKVAVLMEPTSSPSMARLKQSFLDKYPQARWFEFASLTKSNERAGTQMAFGSPHRILPRLDRAQIIVTLDADPLGTDPMSALNTRRFVAGRDADNRVMSRLYAVESQFSNTGAMADHHLALPLSQIESFVAALEEAIDSGATRSVEQARGKRSKVFAALVDDLLSEQNRGKSLLLAGDRLAPRIHARICRLNSKLGNLGNTVELLTEEDSRPGVEQLAELAGAIGSSAIGTLLIVGGNPVYDAPVDLQFGEAIERVGRTFHFSYYDNETTEKCKVHGNLAHGLESWGDFRAADGSHLIAQPLIGPLFAGWSPLECFAYLVGEGLTAPDQPVDAAQPTVAAKGADGADRFRPDARSIVQATAQLSGTDDFDRCVYDGFVPNSAATPVTPPLNDLDLPAVDTQAWYPDWESGDVELLFTPSSSVYDGRFANNSWLQELPDFLTKIAWDNAANMSPKTARVLQLRQAQLATFRVSEELAMELPVNIVPGMANGTVAVELGYGRTRAGRVGGLADMKIDSVGHDVGRIRSTNHWDFVPAVAVTGTRRHYQLATTQEHFRIDALGQGEINRRAYGDGGDAPLIREGTFEHYMKWLTEQGGYEAASQRIAASLRDQKPDANADAASSNGHATGNHSAEDHAAGSNEDGGGHGGDGDVAHDTDHAPGHGHHGPKRWPSDHHLHFKNIDITPRKYSLEVGHKWGMSIDLNKCVGCNACVVACQAENNIPVVGKEELAKGRELHWMRIDRYFVASNQDPDAENVAVALQPVACQHCENAPCETVCPVAATVHSSEGLNDMVYNRCIGTRYCGNNCPYKVRRFNYLNYSDARTFIKYPGADSISKGDRQLKNLMMNPEVTIRSRGVMEKCTFCVQRIQNTKIQAKNESREIGPNEIMTACQQACPAEAIKFGDLHNDQADVTKNHSNPRAYVLLEEMNNFPRNRFLARVRNPHPSLVGLFEPTQQHA